METNHQRMCFESPISSVGNIFYITGERDHQYLRTPYKWPCALIMRNILPSNFPTFRLLKILTTFTVSVDKDFRRVIYLPINV